MGRLVIDLPSLLEDELGADILLRDGDVLVVPEEIQEVTVIGEVQFSTSHLFTPGQDRDDYIGLVEFMLSILLLERRHRRICIFDLTGDKVNFS